MQKKFAKMLLEVRHILSGVKHLQNGDAICTDSHRLYLAKGVHDRTDGAVLTQAGKSVDGNYPDVSRIIPDYTNAKQTLNLEVNELLKVADIIANVGSIAEKAIVEGTKKESKHPTLEFKEDVIRYVNFQCNINYSFYPIRFEELICADAVYVLDAMKLFKAVGCQTVTLHFHGSMRPFTFTNENEDLTALILPVRKY
jgi:DNA polymerase III sliding clamp (beta) subunit (PCNA family)